jgi:outer membrane lipoprotein-sorting protein
MSSTCELVQQALSARLDGEEGTVPGADDHVVRCADCSAFLEASTAVRRELRIAPVADVPDVAAAVARQLDLRRRTATRTVLVAAAAFLIGLVSAATLLGVGGSSQPAFAGSLPDRLLAAQRQVETLQATVTVTEHGWHADVGRRQFEGTLTYEAPESFALHLQDRTDYPGPDWVPGDIDVVVDDDKAWTRGVRSCPTAALPACTPPEARTATITQRAPFDAASPVPLDLAVPAASFEGSAAPAILDQATIAGRPAIAVEVTAAQLDPLLSAFAATGNLRAVHPADPVRLWLDHESLVALRVEVRAAEDPERARWAASRSYDDGPGEPVLTVELRDVAIDETLPSDAFAAAPPKASTATDGGFEDDAPVEFVPAPRSLPSGLAAHRSGTLTTTDGGKIGVRTWNDGLRWLQIRATTDWGAGRLFGVSGDLVVPVTVADGSTVYADRATNAVSVHADDVDVAVSGNMPLEDLIDIAADLPVEGRPVPNTWAEAEAASLTDARATLPSLELPQNLEGFGDPVLAIDEGFVVARYTGAGIRSFVLTQGPGSRLPPPLDNDAFTVTIDGHQARWSPARGELEWVDGDRLVSLRSTTVALAELAVIGEEMVPA